VEGGGQVCGAARREGSILHPQSSALLCYGLLASSTRFSRASCAAFNFEVPK
jgi:hypothetical protein